MTTAQGALFLLMSVVALVGALGTVLSAKPLRAAMSLLLTVMAIAAMYLSLHAELLASLQMLVYAGAVVVLFVFVIMLIGPEGSESRAGRRAMIPIVGAVFLGSFTASMASFVGRGTPWVPPTAPAGYGSVEGLGRAIYLDGAVPFETISVTLLVAILSAVAVARGRTAHEAAVVKRDRAARAAGDESA